MFQSISVFYLWCYDLPAMLVEIQNENPDENSFPLRIINVCWSNKCKKQVVHEFLQAHEMINMLFVNWKWAGDGLRCA